MPAPLSPGGILVYGTGQSMFNFGSAPASPTLKSDGALPINFESEKATYTAYFPAFTPVATPTDIFQLTGSATKTIRITRIEMSVVTTSAVSSFLEARIAKRTALSVTGATLNAITPTPHRIGGAGAATALAGYISSANWTTLGTLAGYMGGKLIVPQLATFTATNFPPPTNYVWTFGDHNEGALVLAGVADCAAMNWSGATLVGTISVTASITFTEEANTY